MYNINASALVSRKAQIGENVTIGPHAIMEDDVEIGKDSSVGPFAVIGLRRRGFFNEDIQTLKKTYTYLYDKALNVVKPKLKLWKNEVKIGMFGTCLILFPETKEDWSANK